MGFSSIDNWPWTKIPKQLVPKPKNKSIPMGRNCSKCNRLTIHSVPASCGCYRILCLICDITTASWTEYAYNRRDCDDCMGQ